MSLKRISWYKKSPSLMSSCRHIQDISEELQAMMHGRRNKERRDSVTPEILNERLMHQKRITELPSDERLVQYLETHGLGVKRRRAQVYQKILSFSPSLDKKTTTGAGGFAVHIASAAGRWPLFDHLLPEIVFAGHSNSGKSTLVNAMVGVLPRKGPASISERAGWTDQICFYKLGKRPPILTLVDFPGYGHAVASSEDKRAWTAMTRDFILQREILSLCCVLVDSTRGLCEQDMNFLRFLSKVGVPRMIILTKSDLLDVEQLAGSITAVAQDLMEIDLGSPSNSSSNSNTGDYSSSQSGLKGPLSMVGFDDIMPVSAATGAGVQTLWKLNGLESENVSVSVAVREHRLANEMRKKYAIEASNIVNGVKQRRKRSSSTSMSMSMARNRRQNILKENPAS
eukprot:gene5462-10981_t